MGPHATYTPITSTILCQETVYSKRSTSPDPHVSISVSQRTESSVQTCGSHTGWSEWNARMGSDWIWGGRRNRKSRTFWAGLRAPLPHGPCPARPAPTHVTPPNRRPPWATWQRSRPVSRQPDVQTSHPTKIPAQLCHQYTTPTSSCFKPGPYMSVR
jgi:hypothetical protein